MATKFFEKIKDMTNVLRGLVVMASLLVVSPFAVAASASVYVSEIKGVNVPENELSAIDEIVRNKVHDHLGHNVVSGVGEADYVIEGKVIRLGEAFSITLVKSKGGREVYRSTLKSAMMSDVDVVIVRLLTSLDREESVDKVISVRDMTLDEQENQRRRRDVLKQWFFGLGPIVGNSLNINDGGILWNVGYNFEMDYTWDMHLDLDYITAHSHSESDGGYLGLNFGLNHYFSEQDNSPMIEAHISYGWMASSTGCSGASLFCSSGDKASGWGIGGGIGYRFFRTAKTNFSVILRGVILGDKFEVSNKTPMAGGLMLVGYFN